MVERENCVSLVPSVKCDHLLGLKPRSHRRHTHHSNFLSLSFSDTNKRKKNGLLDCSSNLSSANFPFLFLFLFESREKERIPSMMKEKNKRKCNFIRNLFNIFSFFVFLSFILIDGIDSLWPSPFSFLCVGIKKRSSC